MAVQLSGTWHSLFSVACIAVLFFSAQKSRELIGKDNLSRTEDLSWQDCFDLGTGSLACMAKQATKLYTFNIRAGYVERAKQRAYELAYHKCITDGLNMKAAAKQALKAGQQAGKLASRKHRRITGPLLAGTWDLFEVLYYGGSLIEGSMKAVGTVGGTWAGGMYGEQRFGNSFLGSRVGYLVGSQVGSWVGGKVGLMVYDVANGIREFSTAVTEFVDGSGSELGSSVGDYTEGDGSSNAYYE